MNFFDADGLAGKDRTEVVFFVPHTDSPAIGDDDGLVVERIVDVGQSGIGPGGWLIDFGRALHVQGFMRTFVVEDFEENLNDETLGASENGITVGWLVPKIGPDIEPKRMFTSTVALPFSVRRLTKFR